MNPCFKRYMNFHAIPYCIPDLYYLFFYGILLHRIRAFLRF